MSLPAQIGKYRIIDRLGEGAMGEVFRAHDGVLDRQVALKIIAAGDEDRRQRFQREAQSAARLTHPNIVVVHDFGEDSGRFFMAMELLEGSDLKKVITDRALPEVADKLRVMEQICDAVGFAHATRIVHRDLKPANIFLLASRQVKILDFGLAHIAQSDMTGTGAILGTPNYMAPEQIRGQKIDARADIFALGAVFYELLTGRRAFSADSLHGVMYRVMHEAPEPVRTTQPNIAPAIAEIVERALQKDPALRFQSAVEMRDAIYAVRGGMPGALSMTMRGTGSTPLPPDPKRDLSLVSGTLVWRASGEHINLDVPATVTFAETTPKQVVVDPGQTLLEASLHAGIPHTHECGGNARCSTCRVLVVSGAENLSPRDSAELRLAKKLGFPENIRLACQTTANGPATVRRLILDRDDVRLARADRDTETSGVETPLAILAVHVREFGSLVRRHLPYDIIHILNRFYLHVGDAVLANGGRLDRVSSGGVQAFFGLGGEDAKTKCTNAIRAALRISRRMSPFNDYLREHFSMRFTVDLGLHYGRMIVGRIGHPDHWQLTALGDAAGVASAIAQLNSEHQPGIFATEELVNVVEGDVTFGHVSHETPPGQQREFTIYDVIDFAKPDTHYLVQTSFEKISPRREEAAGIFYARLFQIAPEVQPLFAKVDMTVQGAMLMNMLAAAVKGLDRLDELRPMLQDLGRRHRNYGVKLEHYAAVEECLLHTVEVMLGRDFTLDVKLAWTRIYNFIAETMIEAQMSSH